ncbi:MAG: PKD domain-containing protein [Xanthomonadales bacterium]|nr:PKD domain-containing protein [Xanthomonadales bacterium]
MNRLLAYLGIPLLGLLLLASAAAWAATPTSGTLTDSSGPVTFEAGPFVLSNPTPVPLVDSGPQCFNPEQPCDDFFLTISLPDGYANANPNDFIRFTFTWGDEGAGLGDYDFYIYDGVVGNLDGSEPGKADAASADRPEATSLGVCQLESDTLTIKIVPYTSAGETVHGTIELVEGDPPEPGAECGGSATFGGLTPTAPGNPRYQNFYAPDGSAAQGSSGEANIGFNPFSGNIMLMNNAPVFRLTPPELQDPPLPAAGPAAWLDVSPVVASIDTLDPILVTDPVTGRTFISNQTTGAEVLFAFTDDDGETWIEASAAPPTGGVDHQTIGVGPYPGVLADANPVYPNAVYFCTQALNPDFCQRSDTGGLSFAPGEPVNTGITTQCGGLHGHLKVAPNGHVYLPDKSCGDVQGGTMSMDAGVTWQEFLVPDSSPSGSDPSIAIASDNTLYFCYTNENGAWVSVSNDNGQTWQPSVNIGESVGVKNAVFPEAVAGDPDRAACGFLGTDVAGNSEGLDFLGKWYLFIAHTYDGGQTWTTVNATPNDPVQGEGGICTGGLSCGSNRNLLDFNEVTMDSQGNVLFAYDDGCVSETCLASGGKQNDFVAYWAVARQYGGKPLLAAFDPVEPAAPDAPYLDGRRTQIRTEVYWRAPNDAGSGITEYRLYRGESPGNLSQIATVPGSKTRYVDASADLSVETYYYQVVAVNALGAGPASNELAMDVTFEEVENFCLVPGITTLTDGSGDSLTATPGSDVRSLLIAQPYADDGNIKLRFQINTDPGVPVQPPQSFWYSSFRTPDDVVRGVRMVFKEDSPAEPTFESYVAGASSGGIVDGRFVEDGSTKPAQGFYDAPNGVIVINVPIADLGLSPGDEVRGFNGGSVQPADTPAGGAALVVDEMPDGLGRQGTHTLKTNAECQAALNQPPVALLMAEPRSGEAPLTVNFDGGASFDSDEGDSVVSYTFDFNDGSDPVTQAGPTISHSYDYAGNFRARLTVTDSHGANSNNAAEVVIEVSEPRKVTVVDDDDPAVEYKKGWHRRSEPAASNGGYHRRLGAAGGGEPPTARLEFEGDEITYFFAQSEQGGTADVYIDGLKRTTVDYSGDAPAKAPEFGRSVSFAELGGGSHEFLLVFGSGAVYVDGFEITSGMDGGADESAAQTQSETTVHQGEMSLLGPALVTETVNVGPGDEWLSVVVEGASELLDLSLLDASGNLVAAGGPLAASGSAVGLDMAAPPAGIYTVQVLGDVTSETTVEISVSRTVRAE